MIFVGSKLKRTLSRLPFHEPRSCRVCGCTQDDCRGCVERTGDACHWVAPDLCSACTGDALIAQERYRQVEEEGYTVEHDRAHVRCEIRKAAECYERPPAMRCFRPVAMKVEVEQSRGLADPSSPFVMTRRVRVPTKWPWDAKWWKPTPDRVRELVKAGALFMAEADRQKWAGHRSTAKRMEAKSKACGRKIDRYTKDKKWLRMRKRVGREVAA